MPVTAGTPSRVCTVRAERAARHAIAPREEGGARDDEIRLLGGDEVEHLRHRRVRTLRDVVVARDHGRDHAARVAQRLLDGARGAHGPGEHLRPDAGLVLAADLAEELVQVARPLGVRSSTIPSHCTSDISRDAPTCSMAPQIAP